MTDPTNAQWHALVETMTSDMNAMAAEVDRLRRTLIAYVSCSQCQRLPGARLENEAVELCGGMGPIRAHEHGQDEQQARQEEK